MRNELNTLEGRRSDLVLASIEFHAQRVTMVPPTPAEVSALNALANQAVAFTVQKGVFRAILRLATDAMNRFLAIQAF
jgi:hypothetical protein